MARQFEYGDEFLRRMEALEVADQAPPDVVQGRHLIARGYKPSSWFSEVLEVCREVQDETGWDDPEQVLDRALREINVPPRSEADA